MQIILNDLSSNFPVDSLYEGKEIMKTFLKTSTELGKIIHNDVVLLDKEYNSFELAKNYRIEQWRNDSDVDIELKRKFRSLINRAEIYNSEEYDQEKECDFIAEFEGNKYSSKGCLLTYLLEGVAISFVSHVKWREQEIVGEYVELTEDGEIEQQKVKIVNVSDEYNLEDFRKYYNNIRDNIEFNGIHSEGDILEAAEKLFPNLEFCDNAIQGCKKYVGVSETKQVYKRLLELQKAAENMDEVFDKNLCAHASVETSVTLEQYEKEHTFKLPNGNNQLFSWHIRYTGSYAGRIFFYPVPKCKRIFIGHIGHKLPSVKYH